MAKPVSEEELQLKKRARRRLIGAFALVTTVAAVLPMVLDPAPKPTSQEINIQIPSPDVAGGFPAKVMPGAPPMAKAAGEPPSSDVAKAPVVAPEIAPEPPAKAVEKADKADKGDKADRVEKAEKAVTTNTASGGFYIQVIALAESEKAKAVQQKITDAGVRSYTEVVVAGSGKVTRVRAGPFASRAEAERARAQLTAVGLEGKVAGP